MLRTTFAALAAAILTLTSTGVAMAAPAVVDVRVEGATQTLAEGPIRTDGHAVRAASDSVARICDGTNNHTNPEPGPSLTASVADALALGGMDFDAKWYPGYDDYYLNRLGPDAETGSAYWGILDDAQLTSRGGCQWRMREGHEALAVYDAFQGRPFLKLSVAGDDAWPATATTAVDASQPLALQVVSSTGGTDTGSVAVVKPAAGVTVAPVQTAADGRQTVVVSDPSAVVSGAGGDVAVTFATPGWHRLKAQTAGFVRSNRLDVCVRASAGDDCGGLPADARVRQWTGAPPVLPDPPAAPGPTPGAPPAAQDSSPGSSPSGSPPAVTAVTGAAAPTAVAALGAGGAARGRTLVRWTLNAAGARQVRWGVESRTLAPSGPGRWVVRVHGTGAAVTAASLALPAGRTSELRVVLTDSAGASVTATAGRAVVPLDDRAGGVRLHGWARRAAASAWRGTLSRGRAGARGSATLAAGRPVLVLGAGGAVRIELRAGGHRQVLTARRSARTRTLTGTRAMPAGAVALRVLSGTVDLDGVAAAP